MTTRNGKIARLPHLIREELNRRLRDGHEEANILPWLNSLPEVQSVLAKHFAGMPVNQPNLSAWRTGGYRDWLLHREALEFIAALNEEHPSDPEPDPDLPPNHPAQNHMHKLMRWLTTNYAAAAASLSSIDDPEAHWARLRQFCADLSRLRRADLQAEVLRISYQKLELQESCVARQERKERLGALRNPFR